MNTILNKIQEIGMIPIAELEDAKDALPLARALYEGGLPCVEILYLNDEAEEYIKIMTTAYPDMIVCAGCVMNIEQVKSIVNAGASLIITSGFNVKVIKYCMEKKIPITPGVSNPSEIERAMELGVNEVHFFPAQASGGMNIIKEMTAFHQKVKFITSGGIQKDNINEYLAYDKIIACCGTWMINNDLVKNGKFDRIRKNIKKSMESMLNFKLKHIGIHTENKKEAEYVAGMFERLFGMKVTEEKRAYVTGESIAVMKNRYIGKKGHIAIETNSILRAIAYLKNKGVSFDMRTAEYKDGKIKEIYLNGEIAGFAIHLIQH